MTANALYLLNREICCNCGRRLVKPCRQVKRLPLALKASPDPLTGIDFGQVLIPVHTEPVPCYYRSSISPETDSFACNPFL